MQISFKTDAPEETIKKTKRSINIQPQMVFDIIRRYSNSIIIKGTINIRKHKKIQRNKISN